MIMITVVPFSSFEVVYKTTEPSSWEYIISSNTNFSIDVDVREATFVTFQKNKLSVANLNDS